EAVGGGFTSRVIFVVEERKRKIVPEHFVTDAEKELQGKLVRDLERISKLAGAVEFTDEGKKLYTDWYIQQDTELSLGRPVIDDTRFAGYCERRATHIRKLMMLCSASRGDDLTIRAEDFHRAKGLLEAVEVKMGKTFGGFGKARNSDVAELIKDYIQKMGITTRKSLMQKFYRDIDPMGMSIVEQSLREMGVIKVTLKPEIGEKVYEWIGG
ncbi:MAG: hypothetical protein KGI54_16605, partial [Pseudomonadota bacterium]|nr:hypothetical protein [Pseudomonadota bacterium]